MGKRKAHRLYNNSLIINQQLRNVSSLSLSLSGVLLKMERERRKEFTRHCPKDVLILVRALMRCSRKAFLFYFHNVSQTCPRLLPPLRHFDLYRRTQLTHLVCVKAERDGTIVLLLTSLLLYHNIITE